MQPTLAGFISFLRNVVGIPTSVLPDDSPTITMAYTIAIDLTNLILNEAIPDIYTLAVYNLGASNVLNYGQDPVPVVVYKNNAEGLGFFAFTRQQLNMNGFVPGVINSASDVSTSQSMTIPKAFEDLTIADLQYLKDPYGRQYLAFAQKYGTLWGIS